MSIRVAAGAFALALLTACGAGVDTSPRSARPASPDPLVARPRAATTMPRATVAVVGDAGVGEEPQRRVAEAICAWHDRVRRLDAVVTTGDNVYQDGAPEDFPEKFFEPYTCVFRRAVPFRAALGNHDVATDHGRHMIGDPAFGMKGRYYSFAAGPAVFVVLDSNDLDAPQLAWLDRTLRRARSARWTIAVLHHPPYSAGTEHGPSGEVRALLSPRFERYGVDLVLSGHEHLYSRATADGVPYVVTGGGGAALYPCADPLPPETDVCRSVHHFLVLRIGRALLVEARAPTDGAFDTFRVGPRP